jgi:hypothetical protein
MLIWALIIIAHELIIIVYLMVIVLRQGRWIRRMQAELDRRAAARQEAGPRVDQDEASGAKPSDAEQPKQPGTSTIAPSAEPDWQSAPPPVRTKQKA